MQLHVTAISLAILQSCANMPEKPAVRGGFIDYPRDQIVERTFNGQGPRERKPLSTYHKARCFQPDQWEIFANYIDELETYARVCESGAKQLLDSR